MQHLTIQLGALISFPLDCQIKKITTADTRIDVWCEWIKIIPIFLADQQEIYIFWCATEF